ncbi:hypothetical protein P350_01305 [Burkholderia cepacia JBK9]|nr:hypothetical protein P350_01305 [Burkholderia cepacia JBK9]
MEKIQRLPTLRPGSMPARAFRRTVSGCAPSRAAAPGKSTVAAFASSAGRAPGWHAAQLVE